VSIVSLITFKETNSKEIKFEARKGNFSKVVFLICLRFAQKLRDLSEVRSFDKVETNVCSVISDSLKVKPKSRFCTSLVRLLFSRSMG